MTSTIKVNNIQNQCGANIINESANTITIGASGDTISLAAGASQSGFGRTGTVNWVTTKKTTSFTAVSGEGYFCDTSGGAFTLTLPASPSAGDIVGFKDYSGDFSSNNLTIGRNGEPINGGNFVDPVISTAGASIFLVYVDATQGWIATQDDSSTFGGQNFMVATGGTITTCGNCKIHTFTGPGTFTVSTLACTAANNEVSYMVIAGGGGGGGIVSHGGGGGAGGFRETKSPVTPYTASPLCGYGTPGNRITVTATSFPITVGGGGARNTAGANSVFSTITSAGGGGGGNPAAVGDGGSGGGEGGSANPGGSGNTPPVTPSQGNNGGAGNYSPPHYGGGGGGGAGATGSNGTPGAGGPGGNGVASSITGVSITRAGGGGGSSYQGGGPNAGGTGGGGTGTIGGPAPNSADGTEGTANTGGGGGGGERCAPSVSGGRAGGSGIVVIRYKFQ